MFDDLKNLFNKAEALYDSIDFDDIANSVSDEAKGCYKKTKSTINNIDNFDDNYFEPLKEIYADLFIAQQGELTEAKKEISKDQKKKAKESVSADLKNLLESAGDVINQKEDELEHKFNAEIASTVQGSALVSALSIPLAFVVGVNIRPRGYTGSDDAILNQVKTQLVLQIPRFALTVAKKVGRTATVQARDLFESHLHTSANPPKITLDDIDFEAEGKKLGKALAADLLKEVNLLVKNVVNKSAQNLLNDSSVIVLDNPVAEGIAKYEEAKQTLMNVVNQILELWATAIYFINTFVLPLLHAAWWLVAHPKALLGVLSIALGLFLAYKTYAYFGPTILTNILTGGFLSAFALILAPIIILTAFAALGIYLMHDDLDELTKAQDRGQWKEWHVDNPLAGVSATKLVGLLP